jgi:hypothetical protein
MDIQPIRLASNAIGPMVFVSRSTRARYRIGPRMILFELCRSLFLAHYTGKFDRNYKFQQLTCLSVRSNATAISYRLSLVR